MTVVAEASETVTVTGGGLAGDAYRLAREHMAALAPVWFAFAAWFTAQTIWRHATGLEEPGPHALAAELGDFALALGPSLASAVALRVLAGAPAWRLDRGLVEYVGLTWAASVLSGGAPSVIGDLTPGPVGVARLPILIVQLALVVVLIWLGVRLQLWPVGRLFGAPATAGQSWRRTRGAVWPYVWGFILVVVAPFVPALVFFKGYAASGAAPLAIAAAAAKAVGAVLAAGVTLRLYQLRGAAEPAAHDG